MDNCGIYMLITNLCEKFSQDPILIRKLRPIAYGILLNKQTPTTSKLVENIKNADSYCNLLAWQFTLSQEYGLVDHAEELNECGQVLQHCFGNDSNELNRHLQFLLNLRQIPIFSEDSAFELPLISEKLPIHKTRSNLFLSKSQQINKEENIWELASKADIIERRNWESFGLPESEKELPFLSEFVDDTNLFTENLPSVYFNAMFTSKSKKSVIKPKMKTSVQFIKDLKYLMVGLASESFNYDEIGNFTLVNNLLVNGTSPDILLKYCEEFLQYGNYFKALQEISTPNPTNGKFKHDGYIFAEFCASIQRFLDFSRTAIFNLPEKIGLIQFSQMTKQMQLQISTLSIICKLNSNEQVPNGVALLNYLYQKILNLTNENYVILVLYSILFPCCQVYFSRFLQQWILYGNLNDPFDEFFIKKNVKYYSTKGRTYWTRSFLLREDIVPDFLVDLSQDILNCGKSMNLIKSCCQSNKLCFYLMGKKPSIFTCCITTEQLNSMEQYCTNYYLEISEEIKPKFNLGQYIEHFNNFNLDEKFLEIISIKRLNTLKRIELERRKLFEEESERKRDEMIMLKEQYNIAIKEKQMKIADELECELKTLNNHLANHKLRHKLIEEESRRMIDYYDELNRLSDNRKRQIEKHCQVLKQLHFNVVEEMVVNENNVEISKVVNEPEMLPKIKKIAVNLTEAERNKLRVMSSDFDFRIEPEKVPRQLTQCEINRNNNMKSNECFYYNEIPEKECLKLELELIDEKLESSVDTTPLSDCSSTLNNTSTIRSSTSFSTITEPIISDRILILNELKGVFSKRVKLSEIENENLNNNCLKLFLYQSISIPLITQQKLINNELLRVFINDYKFFQHLLNLRDYFLMENGEFSRHITENLFEKLYNNSVNLFTCRTLQKLLFEAVKHEENSLLSFKINNLPKFENFTDPNLIDCLSLSYEIKWPLNILLPIDTINKYDDIFRYLLKINRISWVLKQIYIELKLLAKQTGQKEIYLMMSSHYRQVHQYRHIMLHFIQTLQNYLVWQVFQPSWQQFQCILKGNVETIDDLYLVHTSYIKSILFLCLLNQKSAPLQKIIQKIFMVILKFYDYLRSRCWQCENGIYIHPNFEKLSDIFANFQEFVLYLFKIGRKCTKTGYQPELVHLLDMLNINNFYSKTN